MSTKKPIARLRKGIVHTPKGKLKRIEAVSEKGTSGPAKTRGKVVGRGDFTGRHNIDRAIDSLKKGIVNNKHLIRFPDGSVEDPEEEE
jgi:hypothetical protein